MGRKAVILGLPILAALLGLTTAPWLPDRLDMLWAADGTVKQSMSKYLGLLILPAVGVVLGVGLLAQARLWKDRFDGESHRLFEHALIATQVALLVVYLGVLATNAGLPVSPRMFGPLVAAMAFFGAGVLVSQAPRNPLLGVRTRHTLADAHVWAETNQRVAFWLKIAAAICLLGLIFPALSLYFIVGPALLIAVGAHLFAARLYRQRHPDG